jgi:hypothetical protein
MNRSRGLLLALAFALPACSDRGARGEERLRAMVDSLLPALEELSGLEVKTSVVVERRTAAQVRTFVERKMAEDFPPGELEGIHAAYAMLGMLPDTLNLRRLLGDLYQEQIVGYYDPDSTTLYVVDGVPAAALRPVLAHELVHALQDQHVRLDSLIARERGNDRQLAAQAAIEGHATLVMFAWIAGVQAGAPVPMEAMPDPAADVRAGLEGGDAFPVFQSAPRLLREVLVFPYAAGSSFVHGVWASRPPGERPPFEAIIPASTEQVLSPREKFLYEVDVPTSLSFAHEPAGALLHENSFGAFEMSLFLDIHGESRDAAVGWDGDRYRVVDDADGGGRMLEWFSVWDDSASAVRFAAAARRATAALAEGRKGSVRLELGAARPSVWIVIGGTDLPADSRAPGLVCAIDDTECVIEA